MKIERVKDLIKGKSEIVVSVGFDQDVAGVMEILAEKNIGAVLVLDSAGKISGLVSERDIIRGLAKHGPEGFSLKVAEVMTRDPVACTLDCTIYDVMSGMTEGHFRHMPIVEAGILTGILTLGDVVKARIDELEEETQVMRDFITVAG